MDTVVLYPSPPGMGHLVSMVELGKLLLLQHPSVSVTILTTPFPFGTSAVSMFIAGVTSAIPSISFHSLPPVSLSQVLSSCFNMEQITFDICRLNDSNVHDALASLSPNISSIIVDMFCSSAVPLAAQFCFPSYVFYTSSASCLLMSLRLPLIDHNTKESFKDLLGVYDVDIPGLPPIPAASMPEPLQDRNSKSYQFILESAEICPKADGIIINSFDAPEHKALEGGDFVD